MTAMAEGCVDLTLIVTSSGVLVAAVAFLWNQAHAVLSRRRDFMVAVLEATNLCFCSALGDVEPQDKNRSLARASAMAELGLNGEVRESALNLINRLGPHDAPVGGESVTHEEAVGRLREAFNEFTPELWKHAHPFQRWLLGRERPQHPAPDEIFHSTGSRDETLKRGFDALTSRLEAIERKM